MTNDRTRIDLGPSYARKIELRRALTPDVFTIPTAEQQALLTSMSRADYRAIIAASLGRHLTFEEAFHAGCFALRASNRAIAQALLDLDVPSFGDDGDRLAARELLSGLAMKESWSTLEPQEIAGLVTAVHMDVVDFCSYGSVIETCGMGGDRGHQVNGEHKRCKTINSSTLTALTLASLGLKTCKHGSYANTSAIGSTEAIEKLGLVVDVADRDVQRQLAASGFHYTDAHGWKTVHDLSHLEPRRETVNHILGPMTIPVCPNTKLNKMLGVNEKLHPERVARAYQLLHERGTYCVNNVAVIAGLSTVISDEEAREDHLVKPLVILDELSPFSTVVSFVKGGQFHRTLVLTPRDFGVTFRDPRSVFVENTGDAIMTANRQTIYGVEEGRQLVAYLAMNAALGLYLVEYMDVDAGFTPNGRPSTEMLRDCFRRCESALLEGRAHGLLVAQVELTSRLSRERT